MAVIEISEVYKVIYPDIRSKFPCFFDEDHWLISFSWFEASKQKGLEAEEVDWVFLTEEILSRTLQ